jgi:hypothetical protein
MFHSTVRSVARLDAATEKTNDRFGFRVVMDLD